jgi:drug/metabolite transporter (DMT)-like permease
MYSSTKGASMRKYKKESILSVVALAFVALTWGTSYAIIKDALNTIRPFTLMTLRFGLSTIILSILFSKRLKKIRKKDVFQGSIIGIFMFLAFFTLVTGISYTTASKQSFIIGSYVLIVPFLAWIINRKKPDIYSIIGAVLATVGIGLLTINGSFNINKGDLISILCAISFACHMIAIEHFSKDSDPIISTIMQFAVTSILFIILTATFESFNFVLTSKLIISVAYLVIVTTVIAFAVQNIAQKYISATSTALILTLESTFGGVFAVIVLNETMSIQMIIGCIIVLIGIIIEESKCKFIKKGGSS